MTPTMKYAFNAFIPFLLFSAILFISAGKIDYFQGWIYLFTNAAITTINILVIRISPGLMNERAKPGEGIKSWDKALLGLSFLVFVVTIVLAGLDSGRYRLSPDLPWSLYGAGIVLMIAGQLLFSIARNENKFFSTVVRIQKDRGHTVCDSGVYRIVRHPGYLGMMISTLGIPLVLGSLWSAIPSAVSIMLLCVRTFLEDETLKRELEGYVDYTTRVPYRLLPWMW